ncbi:hypothetical protein F4678DRAFT_461233 [Xylaria arbuscula]|nr:hypothetical protein F4678DRAFT_461233 [Xylaria arbuscula]
MAILDDAPGIEVTVQIAGKDATEYEAGDEESKPLTEPTHPTVTKYIESVDDAEFAIKLAASRKYAWGYKKHVLTYEVFIDGDRLRSKFMTEPAEKILDCKKAFCAKSRQWRGHKFRFSAISITEDFHPDSLMQDVEIVRNLGLIKVVVEFSSSKQINASRTRGSKPLPGDHGPIAVFQFLYRSKEALYQSLIIPRPPPSSILPLSPVKRECKPSPDEIKRSECKRFEKTQSDVKPKNKVKSNKRKIKSEDENPSPTKKLAPFVDLNLD